MKKQIDNILSKLANSSGKELKKWITQFNSLIEQIPENEKIIFEEKYRHIISNRIKKLNDSLDESLNLLS